LVKFDSLKNSGDALSRGVSASKIDTSGTGPTQAANYVLLEAQNRIRLEEENGTADVLNMSDVFDKYNSDMEQTEKEEYNKMIHAFNEFGFLKPLDILNKIFPYNGHLNTEDGKITFMTNPLFKIKQMFSQQKGTLGLNEREANKVQRAYLTYKISGFDFFDYNQAKDIIENLPEELLEYKKNNPDSPYSLLLSKLEIVAPKKRVPIKSIEYYTTGKDPITEEIIRLSWESMLEYGTKEEKELATKLVKYAFFQSGFEYGAFSFMHLVPVEFWKNLKNEQGQSFNDFLRGVETELATSKEMTNTDREFTHQFIQNNPEFSSVKVVTLKDKGKERMEQDGSIVLTAGRDSDFYTRKVQSTNVKDRNFVDYIRYYDKFGNLGLYRKDGNPQEVSVDVREQRYVKVERLGTNFFLQEYNINGSISEGLMKGKKVESTFRPATIQDVERALAKAKGEQYKAPDPKSEDKTEATQLNMFEDLDNPDSKKECK